MVASTFYMHYLYRRGALGAGMDIGSIVDENGNVVDLATQSELDTHARSGHQTDQDIDTLADARIVRGVEAWARDGQSALIPVDKIPAAIARDTEIPALSDNTPVASTTSAGSAGTSDETSRSDHRHQAPAGSGGGGGSTTFTGLSDTPANYDNTTEGQVPAINSDTDGLEWITPVAITSSYVPVNTANASVGSTGEAADAGHDHGVQSGIIAGGSGQVETHLRTMDGITGQAQRVFFSVPSSPTLGHVQEFIVEFEVYQTSGTTGAPKTGSIVWRKHRPAGGWGSTIINTRPVRMALNHAVGINSVDDERIAFLDFYMNIQWGNTHIDAHFNCPNFTTDSNRRAWRVRMFAKHTATNYILPDASGGSVNDVVGRNDAGTGFTLVRGLPSLDSGGADANKTLVVNDAGDAIGWEYDGDSHLLTHIVEITRQLHIVDTNSRTLVTGQNPDAQFAIISGGESLTETEIDGADYHTRLADVSGVRYIALRVKTAGDLTHNDFQLSVTDGTNELWVWHGNVFHAFTEQTDDTTWDFYVWGVADARPQSYFFDRPVTIVLYKNAEAGGRDIEFDGDPTQVERWAIDGDSSTIPFSKTGLPDPSSATDGQVATISGQAWTIANAASGGGSGVSTFIALTDVDETAFTNEAGNVVQVNSDNDALVFGGKLSDTAPGNTATASAGTSDDFSRADHNHGVTAPAAAPIVRQIEVIYNNRAGSNNGPIPAGTLMINGGDRGSNSAGWLSLTGDLPANTTPGDNPAFGTSAVRNRAAPVGILLANTNRRATGNALTWGVYRKVLGHEHGTTWARDSVVYIEPDPTLSGNSRDRVYRYVDQISNYPGYQVGIVAEVIDDATGECDVWWDFQGRELINDPGRPVESVEPQVLDLIPVRNYNGGSTGITAPEGIALIDFTQATLDDTGYDAANFLTQDRPADGTSKVPAMRLARGVNPEDYVVLWRRTESNVTRTIEKLPGSNFRNNIVNADGVSTGGGETHDVTYYKYGLPDTAWPIRTPSTDSFRLRKIVDEPHTLYRGRTQLPRENQQNFNGIREGEIRYNSTTDYPEFFNGTQWGYFGSPPLATALAEARTVRRAYYQLATSAPAVPTNLTYDPTTDTFGGVGNWVSDPPTPDASVTGQERWGVVLEANRPEGGTFTVRGSLPAHRWQDTNDGLGAQYSASGTSGWSGTLSSGLRHYVRFWDTARLAWGDAIPLRNTILPDVVADIGGPDPTDGGVLVVDTSFRPNDYSYIGFRISRTTQSRGQGDMRWTELAWISAADLFSMSEEFTAPTGDDSAMTTTLRAKKGLIVSYSGEGHSRVAAVEPYHSSAAARSGGEYQYVYITPRRTGNTVVDLWVHSALSNNRPFRIIMEGTR